METTVIILGGMLIAIISGAIGKIYGGSGKIDAEYCADHRTACYTLVIEKINSVQSRVDDIHKLIKNGSTFKI